MSGKRQTVLPLKLPWSNVQGSRLVAGSCQVGEITGKADRQGKDTQQTTVTPNKPGTAHVAINTSITAESLGVHRSLSQKKISAEKYHRLYTIDQAGPGIVALKDSENLPIYLIKDGNGTNTNITQQITFASHRNIVSLISEFSYQGVQQQVYQYEHMAVSMGCVAGSVNFSQADVATVCREVLQGLRYIHAVLKVSYGLVDLGNILLTWQGEIKLGKKAMGGVTLGPCSPSH
ncbi:hypothetical protein N7539_007703 [Penicillium diatomitis]|uniref:Protein kinase domain-containing protein n=1 Tax=Penicillium diatomitis TaxID=2819901 RepID=A0A9W9WTU0_9EURO|nr:uncharacterized protein N7539_007703 [Penicillium diatomitis]KAJ5475416.1 hypothetical protein N7539_007703 [Penicillium diatomitis]